MAHDSWSGRGGGKSTGHPFPVVVIDLQVGYVTPHLRGAPGTCDMFGQALTRIVEELALR